MIKDDIFEKTIKLKNNENLLKIIELLLKYDLKLTLDNLKTAIFLPKENIELIHFIIKNLIENKIKLTNDIFNSAIEVVSLDTIKLLNQYNCPFDSDCFLNILNKDNFHYSRDLNEDNYFEFMKYIEQLNIDKTINLGFLLEKNKNYPFKIFVVPYFLKMDIQVL